MVDIRQSIGITEMEYDCSQGWLRDKMLNYHFLQ
jgi:hypothetical protein